MVTPLTLSQALLAARRSGRAATLPPGAEQLTLDDAFTVQHLVLQGQSSPAAGWKVSMARPVETCAPFAAAEVLPSGAGFAPHLPGDVTVELEIVVILNGALLPRDAPYTRIEVVAALGHAVAGIEIVQGRFAPDGAVPRPLSVADALGGAALIVGTQGVPWRDLALDALGYELSLGDHVVRAGSDGLPGREHIEDALTWLANHARTRGGLARFTPVLTGARVKLGPLPPIGTMRGAISGLGEVLARFETTSNPAASTASKEQ